MKRTTKRKFLIPVTLLVLASLFSVLLTQDIGQKDGVLIGTENGEVLDYSGGEISQIAEVNGSIHELTRYNEEIFASARFENKSFLYDISDNKLIYSSEKGFHGFEVYRDSIYLGFQEAEDVLKLSMDGRVVSNVSTEGKPHYVKVSDGEVFVGNTNGLIEVFNADLEKRREIKTGSWLGSFTHVGDRTLIAGRKKLKVNTSGHVHEVIEGHITVIDSNRSESINLGPTVVPHGISELENGRIAVTNMVNGTVLIVDVDLNEVTKRIALGPRSEPYFTSLIETHNGKIFAGDIEKNRLYIIDMNEEKIIDIKSIKGIHSIYAP